MPFSRMIRNSVIIGIILAIVFPILFLFSDIDILSEGLLYLGFSALSILIFGGFGAFFESPIALFYLVLHFGIFVLLSLGISFLYNHFRKSKEISFLHQILVAFIVTLIISFLVGLISYSFLI
ncbi:MAG: hypothetical protein AABW79_04600 [Nanoarchaeota archaeon]